MSVEKLPSSLNQGTISSRCVRLSYPLSTAQSKPPFLPHGPKNRRSRAMPGDLQYPKKVSNRCDLTDNFGQGLGR